MGTYKNFELVFSSPTRLAESLNDRPNWVIPFVVVLAVVFVFSVLTFGYQMDYQRATYEKVLRDAGREGDLDKTFAKTPVKRLLGGIGAVVVTALVMLIGSAVLNGVASVAGGPIGFRKMFALYVHMSLISVVGHLVRLPLVFARGSADVRTSLAAFAPSVTTTSPLGTFLNMMDLFAIWMLIALALGYDALGHMGMKKSVAIVFGLWAALVAVLVGLTYLRMVATGLS